MPDDGDKKVETKEGEVKGDAAKGDEAKGDETKGDATEARACGRPWLLAERELGGAKWQLRLLCVRLRSDGGRSLLPSEAE